MSKLPYFPFYPGDWRKDPDLMVCSHFARGLLVDLLCAMFEAKRRGLLARADGITPWTDEQIVGLSSGGTEEGKLAALRELESNGVLKRDSNGVLYSARMIRDEEIRSKRAESGSKGGSKAQAKRKQTAKQTDKQNPEYENEIDNESEGDSGIELGGVGELPDDRKKRLAAEHVASWPMPCMAESLRPLVASWQLVRKESHGTYLPLTSWEQELVKWSWWPLDRWQANLATSITACAKFLCDGDFRDRKPRVSGKAPKYTPKDENDIPF